MGGGPVTVAGPCRIRTGFLVPAALMGLGAVCQTRAGALRGHPGASPVGQYASTTRTSSSVISPSTMRYERNWKGPASSVSAVETRT